MQRPQTSVLRKPEIPPVYRYRINLSRVNLNQDEVVVGENLFVEICEQTANVNCIKAIIKSKLDLFAPIILDSTFQIINESKFTRGELYWNKKKRFYFTTREEYNSWNGKVKKITYQIYVDKSMRSRSMYFPVTGPRDFRRAFTRIKVENDQIFILKNYPCDLNEFIANVDFIHKTIASNTNLSDPIILDCKFREVKDSSTTRGEIYWNTNQKFYFTERSEWIKFFSNMSKCSFHLIKHKKINYLTYFDKSRSTYYNKRQRKSSL